MAQKYPVVVICDKIKKNKYKTELKVRFHLDYRGRCRQMYYFSGTLTELRYAMLTDYCRARHIRYELENSYGQRSLNYRRDFFRENKPVIKNYYICAYCGRFVRRDKITVDHLYPIAVVKSSVALQKKLRKKGILDVNGVGNLVPACFRCNRKKGTEMGSWIWRGKIG